MNNNGDIYNSYKFVEQKKGMQTIPSNEIAEMMDKEHKEVLVMIHGKSDRKGIVQVLTESQMAPSEYFIKSSYKDSSGKNNICYECTKLGCDLLANKMTGEKGILFSAKYVKKFNQMELTLQEQQPRLPSTYKEALQQLLVQVEENEKLQIDLKENQEKILQIEGTDNLLLVREVAKAISTQHGIKIGEKQLYNKLREWGWVFIDSTEAKQKAIERGYLEVIERVLEKKNGKTFTTLTTKVTGKGQIKILEKLLKERANEEN